MNIRIDAHQAASVAEQVAAAIRRALVSGEFRVDEPLPTVAEFARVNRISPGAVRQALRDLETEGWVVQGAVDGSYVAAPRNDVEGRGEPVTGGAAS